MRNEMTRDEILAMKPGKELNKMVGEKVMEYLIYHYDKDVPDNCYYMLMDEHFDLVAGYEGIHIGERKTEELAWDDCPKFSEDISAAWEVVEKMKEKYAVAVVSFKSAVLCKIQAPESDSFDADCKTEPEAICKAALLAMEGTE